MGEQEPSGNRKRNRIIAIIAGAIIVIAVVLGFAGDYLGLPSAAAHRRTWKRKRKFSSGAVVSVHLGL
jgi:hypothetical protein